MTTSNDRDRERTNSFLYSFDFGRGERPSAFSSIRKVIFIGLPPPPSHSHRLLYLPTLGVYTVLYLLCPDFVCGGEVEDGKWKRKLFREFSDRCKGISMMACVGFLNLNLILKWLLQFLSMYKHYYYQFLHVDEK